ncbi:nucleotidyltransferase [Thermoplasmatales archaeon ex4484_30]|nr:MAG: nucleotidyltransferase [Thermoplasmatales archaeon ex4484_30]
MKIKRKIDADMLLIKTSELSPSHWCQLFSVSLTEPVGVAIASAINCLKEEKEEYEIDEILDYIKDIRKIKEDVKGAAENFFQMAKSWNIFDKKGLPISKIVQGGKTTILDISSFSEDLKILIVTLIARKIFEERVKERKRYEEKLMEGKESKEEIPLTWMAIDEAHVFLPMEECPSKDVLIKQWMRQGRQPGVSLILATQRPSTLDPEVLSHSDIIICHRLTAQEDIDALNKVRPTYMQGEIKEAIKKVGTEKGVALIIDDTSEAVHIIKIRPRLSWHGGEEPSALG